jgi:hypothetical protein
VIFNRPVGTEIVGYGKAPVPSISVPVDDLGADAVPIRLAKIEPNRLLTAMVGTDLHPICWADDDAQYGCGGDGFGFSGGTLVNWIIYKMTGGPVGFVGTDLQYGPVGGINRKLEDIICKGGVFYLWYIDATDSHWVLWKSTDHFATAPTITSVNFDPAVTGVTAFHFIQYGKDYQNAQDGYFYMFGNGYLVRVPTGLVETQSAYEVFTGGSGDPTPWSTAWGEKALVMPAPFRAFYHPSMGVYLGVQGDFTFGASGFYWADQPWGPWQLIGQYVNVPTFDDLSTGNGNFIAPKWSTGTEIWLTFSGIGTWDRWNAVPVTLQLGPRSASWVTDQGLVSRLFTSISDGPAKDDGSYLKTVAAPNAATIEVQLGTLPSGPLELVVRAKLV